MVVNDVDEVVGHGSSILPSSIHFMNKKHRTMRKIGRAALPTLWVIPFIAIEVAIIAGGLSLLNRVWDAFVS